MKRINRLIIKYNFFFMIVNIRDGIGVKKSNMIDQIKKGEEFVKIPLPVIIVYSLLVIITCLFAKRQVRNGLSNRRT